MLNINILTDNQIENKETNEHEKNEDFINSLEIIEPNQKFKIKKQIGKGSFGKIYSAFYLEGQEEIALKAISISQGDNQIQNKLKNEITILKKTQNIPNIVQFKGAYLEIKKKRNKYLWILLELCNLGSLASYMNETCKPFNEYCISFIAKSVLKALFFLHNQNILHRDIKAANILWDSNGNIRLGDLGEACENESGILQYDLVGTPFFMAPEVCSGEGYYTPADIWAFGITMIELATTQPPFINIPPMNVIFMIGSGVLSPPTLSTEKGYSSSFIDFVNSCLQIEPTKRFTASQLLEHPFINLVNDKNPLYELSQKYYQIIKTEKEDLKTNSNDSSNLSTVKDEITGETIDEFLENLIQWKEENIIILNKLCKEQKFNKNMTAKFLKQSQNNPSTSPGTLRKKGIKKQFQKNLEKFTVLMHIAFKCSSNTFGVIVMDRTINNIFYEKCILGREIIDWIYMNLQLNCRSDAIQLVTYLIQFGLLINISNNDISDVDSNTSIYRFSNQIANWYHYTPSKREKSNKQGKNDLSLLDSNKELTERDWQIILSGVQKIIFNKNDVILLQDTVNEYLWRIYQGKVRVEKRDNDQMKLLSILGPGSMFGEMSLLSHSNVASATITADEDNTQIYKAEITFMKQLFTTEPGIFQRFYKNIAIKLAEKLSNLGSSNSSTSIQQIVNKKSIVNKNDQKLVEIFSLPPTEIIIQEYSCYINKIIKEHGRLFLTISFICFFSQIFGKQTKIIMPFQELTSIKLNKKKQLKIATKKKKLTLKGLLNVDDVYKLILNLQQKHSQSLTKLPKTLDRRKNKTFTSLRTEKIELLKQNNSVNLVKHSSTPNLSNSDILKESKELKEISNNEPLNNSLFQKESFHSESLPRHQRFYLKKKKENSNKEEEILSSEDWTLLMKGASCVPYKKDSIIISEGQKITTIYQIAKGSCKVLKLRTKYLPSEKIDDDEEEIFTNELLGIMNQGEIFGEISFLKGIKTTASIISCNDDTEIYILPGESLKILFIRKSSLAGRFYQYLATMLSNRFHLREKQYFYQLSKS